MISSNPLAPDFPLFMPDQDTINRPALRTAGTSPPAKQREQTQLWVPWWIGSGLVSAMRLEKVRVNDSCRLFLEGKRCLRNLRPES